MRLVVVARNCYSVPCELDGQSVSTRLYPGKTIWTQVLVVPARLLDPVA